MNVMKLKNILYLFIVLALLVCGCKNISNNINSTSVSNDIIETDNFSVCSNNDLCENSSSYEQANTLGDNNMDIISANNLTSITISDPAVAYCLTLYPNQQVNNNTCHYIGRANDEYHSVICEGTCSYGGGCYPDCGHPSSEHCQQATEVKCVCGGGLPPCIFPDETTCPMWDFYRGKCGQNWSYCAKHGYDMKNLSSDEGWYKGGICINDDGKEIGNVYDLLLLGESTNTDFSPKNVKTGVANPSTVYCSEMGYIGKKITTADGDYSICTFSDGSKCESWDFYRGTCGQNWSYCSMHGYDIKNLSQSEGWIYGAICVDKNTKIGVNSIYNLMNLKSKLACQK